MELRQPKDAPYGVPGSDAHWSAAMTLFDAALDATANVRERLLGSQPTTIRRDVERLLGAEVHAPGFLEQPAIERAGLAIQEEESHDDRPPQVPGYRLLHKLDQGGMASVWVAQRVGAGDAEQVAVKIATQSLPTAQWMRLAREGAILARLHHPHIATLIETGTCHDGRPFLALELVDGQPIDQYCEQHQLDLRAVAKLMLQVCSAAEHAHARGIVHCDLKPGNVLVDTAGAVRLIDFSIAKVLDPDDKALVVDPTVGTRPLTLRYASPEQLAGEPLTPRSDVYSLGVLLTKLMTGLVPGHHCAATTMADRRGRSRSAVNKTAPSPPLHPTPDEQRFQTLLCSTLQTDANQRYASVSLLRRDLERFLAASPGFQGRYSILEWTRGALSQCPLSATALALTVGWVLGRVLL